MDCSPPGSSVLGILQARIPEWVAIFFSRGSSRLRDRSHVSCIVDRFFTIWGFLDSSVGKESACDPGDPGSIPGSGRSAGEGIGYPLQERSPGKGKGDPLQYSGLENSMDCIVHGLTKSHELLLHLQVWGGETQQGGVQGLPAQKTASPGVLTVRAIWGCGEEVPMPSGDRWHFSPA